MSKLSNALRRLSERLEPPHGGANAQGAAAQRFAAAFNHLPVPNQHNPPQGPPHQHPPGHQPPHQHPGPEFDPQFGMNNAFGGADLEILRHALGQFNPNTMDVIEHSIEHRTFNGVLAKEEVARRVLCESRFVAPRQVAGVCSEDGQLALEILRCAMPGCIKGLCRSHAIPHEAVHYCPEHYEIVAFAHDTWKKYDQERAREA